MSQPPVDGGPTEPPGPDSPHYDGAPSSPAPGAHRAGGRPTPPPPPPAGAPYWPQPDYQPPPPPQKPIDVWPKRLLTYGLAVLLVAVVVWLVYLANQPKTSTDNTGSPAGRTTASRTTTAPAAGTTSGAAGTTNGTTSTTGGATTGATPTSTSKPTTTKPGSKPTTAHPTTRPTTAKPTAKPTTAPPPAPVAVKAPLTVLNNSRIHGLALTGAEVFRKGGWTVVSTGNFAGRLPQTTVFYQPGYEAAARTLARQFPKVTAVAPAPASLKTGTVLTVVLTRYFVG